MDTEGRREAAATGDTNGTRPGDPNGGKAGDRADLRGGFSTLQFTPDRYSVHVIVNSGLYLQSILYQGQEVSSPKLDLNDGAPGDLELVLSAGVGTVEGTVHWPEESRS